MRFVWRTLLVVLLVLLFYTNHAVAQEYLVSVSNISTEDGLPSRTVQTGLHASDGFIWFGTLQGLSRYDGSKFKTLTTENAGLYSNNIVQLAEDRNGYIWILFGTGSYSRSGPNGIVQLIDIQTLEVYDVKEVYPNVNYPEGKLVQLISDAVGNILYMTDEGTLTTTQNGVSRTISTYQRTLGARWFSLLTVMSDDVYTWFAPDWQHLLKLDTLGNIVSEISCDLSEGMKPLIPTSDHNMLIVKYDWPKSEVEEERKLRPEIWEWNGSELTNTGKRFYATNEEPPIYKNVESYFSISADYPVVLNSGKLTLMDEAGSQFNLDVDFDELPFELEWRSFFDRLGNMWICSVTDGVAKLSITRSAFDVYLNKTSTFGDPTLWRNSRGMWDDENGRVWIANIDGLLSCSIENSNTKPIQLLDREWSYGLRHIDDKLYLGAGDVYVFNEQGDLLGQIPCVPDLGYEALYSFHKTENGRILVGSENGFKIVSEDGKTVVPFNLQSNLDESNKLYVYEIFSSKDGRIWAATSKGMLQLNNDLNGDFILYNRSADGEEQIPIDEVLTAFETDDGSFWLGTNGSGLVHWNRKTGASKSYTTVDGLSSNQICGILDDEQGNLWLSSSSGLMRFNPSTKKVTIYSEKDGIPHTEFNRTSSHKAKNGRLYFGGIDGSIGFYPQDLSSIDETEAPFKFTSVVQYPSGNEEPIDLTQSILESGNVELLPNDLFLTVSFSLLDYRNGTVNYRYRIKDLNEEWIPLEQNLLRLSNLPYGNHTVEIGAQQLSGKWAKPLTFELKAVAPFYLRTWFLALLVVLIILAILLFFRFRTNRLQQDKLRLEEEVKKRTLKIEEDKKTIEKQADELLELDKLKSRFFANISHELRTPLTLILGPLQHALEQQTWENPKRVKAMIERVSRNGEELLRLVEQILDLSRLESGKLIITEKPVELNALIRKFQDPFEQLGESKSVAFSITNNHVDELMLSLDQDKFEKILYNLLSNAFKFTETGGTVTLNVSVSESTIEFAVSDTGAGISAEELQHVFDRFYQSKSAEQTKVSGSGIGLAFAKELSIALGGNLSATSQEGKGSIFTLQLPLTISNTSAPKVEETDKMQTVLALTVRSELKDKTILIVEDNADMRLYIEEVLSEHFQIKTAEDGLAAWEYLQTSGNEIDLVLSDVMMPRMDGFTLLEKVKETESLMLKPFVLLTAKASIESKVKALRIGVDDYLFKPFSTSELLARVCGLLTNLDLRNNSIVEPEDDETVVSLPTFDQNWLSKLEEHCSKNVGNSAYGIADLANEMALSERQLTRNLKKLTGLTPNRYFREIKLHTAREMIKSGRFKTLAEVSYHVGFDDPQYFARIYQEHFGSRPF